MIPITLLDFTLEGDKPLDLGASPGASLRGALYEALAAMYDTGDPARSRYDSDTNPVAWLLRLEDAEKSGGKDAPRPLALRPPLAGASQRQTFTIALYGRGRDTAPMLFSAVAAIGSIGVGRGRQRQKAHLAGVSARDPITGQLTPLIDVEGQALAPLPTPPPTDAYTRFAALLAPDTLSVRFVTPTRIIVNGGLSKQPIFRQWVQRLLERIHAISELYAEPVWIPFHDLLAQADAVRLVVDGTHWQELWSHSRIDGMSKPLSGFIGTAQYVGEISDLLPYLVLGQALQVGKNTVKGCGWYELTYHWR